MNNEFNNNQMNDLNGMNNMNTENQMNNSMLNQQMNNQYNMNNMNMGNNTNFNNNFQPTFENQNKKKILPIIIIVGILVVAIAIFVILFINKNDTDNNTNNTDNNNVPVENDNNQKTSSQGTKTYSFKKITSIEFPTEFKETAFSGKVMLQVEREYKKNDKSYHVEITISESSMFDDPEKAAKTWYPNKEIKRTKIGDFEYLYVDTLPDVGVGKQRVYYVLINNYYVYEMKYKTYAFLDESIIDYCDDCMENILKTIKVNDYNSNNSANKFSNDLQEITFATSTKSHSVKMNIPKEFKQLVVLNKPVDNSYSADVTSSDGTKYECEISVNIYSLYSDLNSFDSNLKNMGEIQSTKIGERDYHYVVQNDEKSGTYNLFYATAANNAVYEVQYKSKCDAPCGNYGVDDFKDYLSKMVIEK